MDTFFLVLLVFLAILAAVDLFVGVSNDAVNFLNSAVGSRIAPFKVVLGVAAVGVLLGATFSGGMMEIARSGVFHPSMFSFSDVIAIYFAVMVTDVLLLNVFNKMGLPTSTTVSIVFELLGAAAGVAINRLIQNGESALGFGAYINDSKALGMISAILVSVVVAFLAGVIVQWITRVIFTFRYDRLFKKLGGIYGGFSLAMIFYFLMMKGAKGASFMTPDVLAFLDAYGTELVLGIFVVCSILLQLGMMFFKTNVFRIIILAGTFALAFAFAGNDLVNFVGVPIAALDSAHIFEAAGAGASASTFTMAGLEQAIPAPTALLLLSGVIMVITLFTSKSARHVIETSVNLSSSAAGEKEQFGATLPGRIVVKGAMKFGAFLTSVLPKPFLKFLASRFEPKPVEKGEDVLPFDYIRASLNLIVSAILIASATSLKLPLSTTYVTFMVAMGSSFADRAWDRETAVYRVSGVITVISGWFVTAFSAFVAAAIAATLVLKGGEVVSVLLMVIAIAVIVKTNFWPNKVEEAEKERIRLTDRDGIRTMLDHEIPRHFDNASELYGAMVYGFLNDDERTLRRVVNRASECLDELTEKRSLYYQMAKHPTDRADSDAKYFYYRSFTGMREIARTLVRTSTLTRDHVANRHRVFTGELAEYLKRLSVEVDAARRDVATFCKVGGDLTPLHTRMKNLSELVDQSQEAVLSDVNRFGLSLRGSELYLVLVQFVRELINRYEIVVTLQWHLNQVCRKEKLDVLNEAHSAAVPENSGRPVFPGTRKGAVTGSAMMADTPVRLSAPFVNKETKL